MKIQKENDIQWAHTGVDPGMSNMGDIMSTPQPLFPSYQLPYSLGGVKDSISPYATSTIGRP